MPWSIEFHPEFGAEVAALDERVREALAARLLLLQEHGPRLGRPHADSLRASRHPNMKELRFPVGPEVWRVAFAFDTARKAILLCGGDKQGQNEKRFYAALIAEADRRFAEHLDSTDPAKTS